MVYGLTKRVVAAREKIYARFAYISSLCVLVLVIVTVIDFVTRSFFMWSLRGGIEISQQLMAYLVLFGLAYTLNKGDHVRVTMALILFPQNWRLGAEIFADVIGLFLCGILFWGALIQFWTSLVSWEWMPAAIPIPYWSAKLAMPIGFFLIGIEFLIFLIGHLSELVKAKR